MDSNYNIEAWATKTDQGRRVYNHNYYLSGAAFKSWSLIKVVALGDNKDLTAKAYFWESLSNPKHEMVRIDITERHYWRMAQASLHESLRESMRPDIPNGTKDLAQTGDVNFVGRVPESDIPAAINFTRGNIFLSINSIGDKSVDVSEIASYIDQALSIVPSKNMMLKEKIRVLKPTEVSAKTNETFVLIKNIRKLAAPETWLKIIVSGGELRREGDALLYVPDQEGKKQVNIFAINPE
jgi:hypothetical protein